MVHLINTNNQFNVCVERNNAYNIVFTKSDYLKFATTIPGLPLCPCDTNSPDAKSGYSDSRFCYRACKRAFMCALICVYMLYINMFGCVRSRSLHA